jgi:RNA recognition motif-containing protein
MGRLQIMDGYVYGQVDKVSIVTDRDTGQRCGFSFVGMANDAEGKKAIAVNL